MIKLKTTCINMPITISGKEYLQPIAIPDLRRVLSKPYNIGQDEIELSVIVDQNILDQVYEKRTIVNSILGGYSIAIVPEELQKYLVDLTWALAGKKKEKLVGREHEIEKAWSNLARDSRCNCILVGNAGVGKNEIAIEMARRLVSGEVADEFLGYHVIKFRPLELMKIAKKDYIRILNDIKKFVSSSKDEVIIYVENLTYMKYKISLAYFLYSIIKDLNVKFICTSNFDDYKTYFLQDSEISKYLNKVDVKEPELKEIYPMVKADIELLKKKYKIEISDDIIKFLIYTSSLCEIESKSPGRTISVLKWAFSNARRKGKSKVEKEDVLECYNTDLQLFEKADPEEKKRLAYHEIGHYIMHRLCKNVKNQEIAFVSILPMMDFLGVNYTYNVIGKQLNYSRRAYQDLIKIYLGGRASEETFSGEYDDGASSDLEAANDLAETLITNYGLSDKEKQVNRSYTTYSGYYLKEYLFSDKLRDELNEEIKAIIDSAYKEVKEAVENSKELIELLVNALLEHEILTGDELEKICKDFEESKN